jgi:hypothetical protein
VTTMVRSPPSGVGAHQGALVKPTSDKARHNVRDGSEADAVPLGELGRLWERNRTWTGEGSSQTELQTNHAAQDAIGDHKEGSSQPKLRARAHA